MEYTAQSNAIIIAQYDRKGVISHVTGELAEHDINIGVMRLSRRARGDVACTIIEVDAHISPNIVAELRALPADGGAGETDYSAYQQDVALLASAEAVREVLRTAGIDAAVSLEDGVCVVTPVDVRDKDAITSLLAVNAGALPWRFAGDAP